MRAPTCSLLLLLVSSWQLDNAYGQTTAAPLLTCKVCHRASDLDSCTGSTTCYDDEECFMDELVTEQLTVVYTGGCRSRFVCIRSASPIGKRGLHKRGDLVACSRCCDIRKKNGELDCNSRLCGIKGNNVYGQTTASPLLTCKVCQRAPDLDSCSGSIKCDADEDCYMDEIVTNELITLYIGGCRARIICKAASAGVSPIGKRGLHKRGDLVACSRCCDIKKKNGELDCNSRLCGIKDNNAYGHTTAAPLLTCTVCQRATNLDACSGSTKCGADEDCYMDEIITNELITLYIGGCRARSVCSAVASPIGKRGLHKRGLHKRGDLVACSRCCDIRKKNGELDCNSRLCGIKGKKNNVLNFTTRKQSGATPTTKPSTPTTPTSTPSKAFVHP